MIAARTGADTNVACRAVGLRSTKAQVAVNTACDQRGIARRYFWTYPHWKTHAPHPVTVMPRRTGVGVYLDGTKSGGIDILAPIKSKVRWRFRQVKVWS